MLSCLTNISVEILLKSLGYAFAFSTIFWHNFPNAVTAKSIKNYLLEIYSVWTKSVGEIDPIRGKVKEIFFFALNPSKSLHDKSILVYRAFVIGRQSIFGGFMFGAIRYLLNYPSKIILFTLGCVYRQCKNVFSIKGGCMIGSCLRLNALSRYSQ